MTTSLLILQRENQSELHSRRFIFDWLNNNPQRWVGKQIRSKKGDCIYTIRDVLRRGVVVLERKWVLYPSTVEKVRQDFVAASP